MPASIDEIAKACYGTFVSTINPSTGKNRAGETYPTYEKLPESIRRSLRESVRRISIELNKSNT